MTHPYIVRSVVQASDVLRVLGTHGELLRLRDVVNRTGFSKGVCFRVLHTLWHCGLVERINDGWRRPSGASQPAVRRPRRVSRRALALRPEEPDEAGGYGSTKEDV